MKARRSQSDENIRSRYKDVFAVCDSDDHDDEDLLGEVLQESVDLVRELYVSINCEAEFGILGSTRGRFRIMRSE